MMKISVSLVALRILSTILSLCCQRAQPIRQNTADDSSVVREYCEDETFVANCSGLSSSSSFSSSSSSSDQVVVIDFARYGRMRIGSCLVSSYGAIGCTKDIRFHLDAVCSGQPSCKINVRDLLVHNPCPRDLRCYLEAKYSCVRVLTSESTNRCRQRTPVLVTDQTGYLSNYVTQETGCGSIDSPWHILASPGQRINVTLLDFGWSESQSKESSVGAAGSVCQVLAIIKDRVMGTSETVCTKAERFSHVHYSVSHDLEIRMVLKSRRDDQGRYVLLRYEVVGCAGVEVSADMWFRRLSSNMAEVGCVKRATIWRLVCDNDHWTGTIGNCSDESAATFTGFIAQGFHLPFGVNLTIIAVVAGLIGLGVLIGGLVILRRRLTFDKILRQPTSKDFYFQKSSLTSDNTNAAICRAQSEEEEVTSTEVMVPCSAMIPGGALGAPPPQRTRGSGTGGDYGRSSWSDCGHLSPSLSSFRLRTMNESPPRYVEHIYESPTSMRKDLAAAAAAANRDSLQYYEVHEPVQTTCRRVHDPYQMQT